MAEDPLDAPRTALRALANLLRRSAPPGVADVLQTVAAAPLAPAKSTNAENAQIAAENDGAFGASLRAALTYGAEYDAAADEYVWLAAAAAAAANEPVVLHRLSAAHVALLAGWAAAELCGNAKAVAQLVHPVQAVFADSKASAHAELALRRAPRGGGDGCKNRRFASINAADGEAFGGWAAEPVRSEARFERWLLAQLHGRADPAGAAADFYEYLLELGRRGEAAEENEIRRRVAARLALHFAARAASGGAAAATAATAAGLVALSYLANLLLVVVRGATGGAPDVAKWAVLRIATALPYMITRFELRAAETMPGLRRAHEQLHQSEDTALIATGARGEAGGVVMAAAGAAWMAWAGLQLAAAASRYVGPSSSAIGAAARRLADAARLDLGGPAGALGVALAAEALLEASPPVALAGAGLAAAAEAQRRWGGHAERLAAFRELRAGLRLCAEDGAPLPAQDLLAMLAAWDAVNGRRGGERSRAAQRLAAAAYFAGDVVLSGDAAALLGAGYGLQPGQSPVLVLGVDDGDGDGDDWGAAVRLRFPRSTSSERVWSAHRHGKWALLRRAAADNDRDRPRRPRGRAQSTDGGGDERGWPDDGSEPPPLAVEAGAGATTPAARAPSPEPEPDDEPPARRGRGGGGGPRPRSQSPGPDTRPRRGGRR